jgi:hypothetical protein
MAENTQEREIKIKFGHNYFKLYIFQEKHQVF